MDKVTTLWFVVPVLTSVVQENGTINYPFQIHFTFAKLRSIETDDEYGEVPDYKNENIYKIWT